MAIKVASKQTATLSTASVGSTEPAPSITSVVVSNTAYNADIDDLALPTTGGNVKLLGKGFTSNYNLFWNGANITANSYFVSATEIRTGVPASSAGNYSFMLFNNASRAGAIYANYPISGFPTWTTGTYTNTGVASVSVQLLASGDAPLTYALQSGSSLPANVTLSSTGLLSGTNATAGVYSFTVIVDDAQLQSTQQAITLTISGANDANFKYNTLLLSGDGTNNANNHSFVDSSTNNFPITRVGNSTQGTFTPYGANWSNYFDGTGDYLSVPDNVAFTMGAGDFTLECWVYLTSISQQVFIGTCDAAGNQGSMSFTLGISNTGTPRVAVGYAGTMYYSSAASNISTGQWYHVAGVRNGAMVNIYVNGVKGPDLNMAALAITDSAETVAIGRNGAYNGEYVTGYISNARIVKGVAVYTGAFTPPTSPLAATQSSGTNISAITGTATSLLTCQSNRLIDNSTNAFAITKGGDVAVQRFSPFSPTAAYSAGTIGGSGYFDGTGDYLTVPAITGFSTTGDLTLECWAYVNSASAYGGLAGMRNSTGGAGISINILNTGYLEWSFTQTVYYAGTLCPLNQWFHVALVRSGSSANNCSCYLNGTRVAQFSSNDEANATDVFIIGRYYANGTNQYFLNGYVSDMRYVKGTAVYSGATYTVPTTPLTAITNTALLTKFTNAGIYDASMQNNLETVGDAKISTAQSKFGGSSMFFDGTGDRLYMPTNTSLNLTGDFTIEMWVYLTSLVPAYSVLLDISTNGTAGANMTEIWVESTGIISYYVQGTTLLTSAAGTITTNAWYHVAVVKNGTSQVLYVNGVSKASATSATQPNPGVPWWIGDRIAGASSGNYPMTGYIDDFRVTKGFARYTANFTPPTAALEVQ